MRPPGHTTGARPADHLILVSVDGLRPELYRDERWPAPAIQELARGGAVALDVRSVFPALTYPAHATIVTGALPARHGVAHNEPFEPTAAAGPSGAWLWDARALRAPTLWDAVRATGGTTTAVSWPVTVGAAIDWCVPDVWTPEDPASIAPVRAHTTPPGLFEELEREATGRLCDATFGLEHLAREDAVGAMAAYLFARDRPTLSLVHVIALDHVRHRLGLDNPKARRAVAAADRAVARLLETVERLGVGERTAVIVTGDHGSVDLHTSLRPNVWLREAGLLADPAAGGIWRARFQASGGSAFLRLQATEAATRAEDTAAVRRALAARPPGERALVHLVERAELDALGADPDAALALAAVPGVALSPALDGAAVQAAQGAGHGYHPDLPGMSTGFVAAGAGIRAGAVAPWLPLENVAPLVAALLNLPLDAPDGLLFPGLLTPLGPTP